jgi:hypothetical protein
MSELAAIRQIAMDLEARRKRYMEAAVAGYRFKVGDVIVSRNSMRREALVTRVVAVWDPWRDDVKVVFTAVFARADGREVPVSTQLAGWQQARVVGRDTSPPLRRP